VVGVILTLCGRPSKLFGKVTEMHAGPPLRLPLIRLRSICARVLVAIALFWRLDCTAA
jgi:hypothetical protein